MCDHDDLPERRPRRRRLAALPPAPGPPVVVLLLLAALAPCTGAGTSMSLPEAKSILERWRPEVHGAIAVKVGEVPYQASVRLYSPEASQHKCGGAVVSPWHVLTAARCISYASPLAPESVFVVTGAVKRSALDQGDVDTVVRKVASIARHPAYISRDSHNDIAVLTLSKALPMERYDRVASVPLPVGDVRPAIGSTCIVSGWGNNTAHSLVESDALLTAEVPFIGRDLCTQMYEPLSIPLGVVCTAHQKGGAGACVGDAGGPLVCHGFLAGIVSWGSGCGANARPTVYTSLADHVEWVREQMAASPRSLYTGDVDGFGSRDASAASTPRWSTWACLFAALAAKLARTL